MAGPSFPHRGKIALRFAVNVFLGASIAWYTLRHLGNSSEWQMPIAMAATVLVSSYLVRVQTMWRQAPITAAIVIAAGLTHHSKWSGFEFGLLKVGEVIFGCLVGLLVSWLMARAWPLAEPLQASDNA